MTGHPPPDTTDQRVCTRTVTHAHVPACAQGAKETHRLLQREQARQKASGKWPRAVAWRLPPTGGGTGRRPLHAPALVSSGRVGRARRPWPLLLRQAPRSHAGSPSPSFTPRARSPTGSFIRSCSGDTRALRADLPGSPGHGFPLPPPGAGSDAAHARALTLPSQASFRPRARNAPTDTYPVALLSWQSCEAVEAAVTLRGNGAPQRPRPPGLGPHPGALRAVTPASLPTHPTASGLCPRALFPQNQQGPETQILSLGHFVLRPQTLSLVAERPRPCDRLAPCHVLSAEPRPARQLPVLIRRTA